MNTLTRIRRLEKEFAALNSKKGIFVIDEYENGRLFIKEDGKDKEIFDKDLEGLYKKHPDKIFVFEKTYAAVPENTKLSRRKPC